MSSKQCPETVQTNFRVSDGQTRHKDFVSFFSFLQERERQAMNTAKRKAWSNFHQPPDDDDDDPSKGPPGSCGGGPGFTTPFNRFVF